MINHRVYHDDNDIRLSFPYILYPDSSLFLILGVVHDVRHTHNSIKPTQSLVLRIDNRFKGG